MHYSNCDCDIHKEKESVILESCADDSFLRVKRQEIGRFPVSFFAIIKPKGGAFGFMAFNQFNQYGQYPQYQQYGYGNQFTQQKSNMEWIMVPGIADIEKVSVQPGQKAWVMVQNDAVFALRTADQMGLVQTDMYRFEKYSPAPAEPAGEYVTRGELEKAIYTLTEKFGGIINESITRSNVQPEYAQRTYSNHSGTEDKKS